MEQVLVGPAEELKLELVIDLDQRVDPIHCSYIIITIKAHPQEDKTRQEKSDKGTELDPARQSLLHVEGRHLLQLASRMSSRGKVSVVHAQQLQSLVVSPLGCLQYFVVAGQTALPLQPSHQRGVGIAQLLSPAVQLLH